MKPITITDVRVASGDCAFLLDDGKTAVLYDTGFAFNGYAIAENIKKVLGARQLNYILLTHSHYDHVLAAPYITKVYPGAKVNPLGDWTGGTNVDTGATNRKLGSDMADGVTGGGLHGKDLSKADVSVNIYAFLEAQRTGKPVELCCSIGDETVNGVPYSEIVETARKFISDLGGFEKFAEWGLV